LDASQGQPGSNWAERLRRAVLGAAPLLLVAQYAAAYTDRTLAVTVAYLVLFGACLWVGPPRRTPTGPEAWYAGPPLTKGSAATIGLALLSILALGLDYQGLTFIAADRTATQVAMGAAGLSLLVAWVMPTITTGRLLVAVVASGLVLRGLGLDVWAIDPSTRDMLALVESAHASLLAGENPYTVHAMQRGSEIPLTYLPGLWLGYLPPQLLDLDIRWMGVVSDLAIIGSLWWAARGVEPDRREWAEAGVFAIACTWFFLPTVHWNGLYAEPHVWWAVLAVLLGAVARDRWWIAAAALGVTVATRHYGVIVLPFVLLAMWRRLGWRAMMPRLAVCGTVTAALLVPFVAADPDAFWFGTFRWLREYGPAHENWFHAKLGFSGYFYRHDIDGWLTLIQVAGLGAIILAALAAGRAASRRVFAFAGTAYLWFVMFNGIIWFSFYLGAFLFVAFALVSPRSDLGPERAESPTDPALAVSAVVVAAALGAGGWLGWTLVRSLSPSGLDRTRTHLSETMASGDALVDRADWHLAFIDGTEVFDATSPPEDLEVGRGLYAGFNGSLGALSSDRVWGVARPGRNGAWIDQIAALGKTLERTRIGRYHLVGVDPPAVAASLSENLDRLAVSYGPAGGEHTSARETDRGSPVWETPDAPSWVEVRPKSCTHDGTSRRGIYAHPDDEGALRLTWENVRLGSRLVVRGGLEDDIVVWDRGDVMVNVRIDGEARESLSVRNRRGIQWRAYDTAEQAGETADVEMTITTDDADQRWFCLDAVTLN